ncbi:hypothetical protein C0J52_25179 [Blattella germanica]|nr:hypothetical protein C0J52_25179 [Blattella germanica]
MGSNEYPTRFPDLTPLDFNLSSSQKNIVHSRKPCPQAQLSFEIEMSCLAVAVANLELVKCIVFRSLY